MKIVIQLFEDDADVEYHGDAVGEADSWNDARKLIDALEKGHTVPSNKEDV